MHECYKSSNNIKCSHVLCIPGFGVDFGELCVSLVQVIFTLNLVLGSGRGSFVSALHVSGLCLRDITDDEACVDELRMMFRFFGAVMVRRAQKVNFYKLHFLPPLLLIISPQISRISYFDL